LRGKGRPSTFRTNSLFNLGRGGSSVSVILLTTVERGGTGLGKGGLSPREGRRKYSRNVKGGSPRGGELFPTSLISCTEGESHFPFEDSGGEVIVFCSFKKTRATLEERCRSNQFSGGTFAGGPLVRGGPEKGELTRKGPLRVLWGIRAGNSSGKKKLNEQGRKIYQGRKKVKNLSPRWKGDRLYPDNPKRKLP